MSTKHLQESNVLGLKIPKRRVGFLQLFQSIKKNKSPLICHYNSFSKPLRNSGPWFGISENPWQRQNALAPTAPRDRFLLMCIHVFLLPVRTPVWVASINSMCLGAGKAEKGILKERMHGRLCWRLGSFTLQQTTKQQGYWHSCLNKGQEPPLPI